MAKFLYLCLTFVQIAKRRDDLQKKLFRLEHQVNNLSSHIGIGQCNFNLTKGIGHGN